MLDELKKINMKDFSQLQNLMKKYPIETMENLFVEPKLGQRIKLNVAQKKVIEHVLNSEDVYALGSRQIAGKSTIALYLAVYLALAYNNYKVYYISLEASRQCADFMRNVETMLDYFSEIFTIDYKREALNISQLLIENTNSVIMTAATLRKKDFSSIAKSRTAHFVIIDEFSDIHNNSQLLSIISPTMAATRKLQDQLKYPVSIMLISNAFEIVKDHHKYAYDLWIRSIAGETNFKPVLFYYRQLLTEEEADRFIEDELKRGVPYKQILINYECYFMRSSNAFLDDNELIENIYRHITKPRLLKIVDGKYTVELYDDLLQTSIISIDTATKYGQDYYAIVGLKDDGSVTFIISDDLNNKFSIYDIIEIIKHLSLLLNDPLIIIERNQGHHIIEFLEGQVNLYYEDKKPGFFTDANKKRLMFSILKEYLYQNYDKIKSERILKQLLTFYLSNNTYKSDEHDDIAMAYTIGIYIINQIRMEEELKYNSEQTKKALEEFAKQVQIINNQDIDIYNDNVKFQNIYDDALYGSFYLFKKYFE